jgi:hypothetical protein
MNTQTSLGVEVRKSVDRCFCCGRPLTRGGVLFTSLDDEQTFYLGLWCAQKADKTGRVPTVPGSFLRVARVQL